METPRVDGYVESLAQRLFKEGPDSLTSREKRALLGDGQALAFLHMLIWKTPSQLMHPVWVTAMEQYRSPARAHRPGPEAIEKILSKARSIA
jgi:membrane glycosyltransferase